MDSSTSPQVTNHPFFAGLPAPAVEWLTQCSHNVSFQPGQAILTEGAPADNLYLLRQGKVAISTHSPGKGHLLVQTLGPGEALGLSWLFPPFQWQFDARAVEFVEALALDGRCLRERIDSDSALGYQLLKRITPMVVQRLQQTRLRLLDLYSADGGNGTARA
ncbi:MAG TPA: cyclic nucleotide-binding domain-containing protein [Acidimicrobiales bacterium]|nr:cyclic nucleotide-binding domain-containing protein [Acidimicrobiales bacterium]